MVDPRTRRGLRRHAGGKLSFRRRLRDPGDAPALYVEGGDDPPPLDELVPGDLARVEVEVGPGKGAFLLAATEARPDTFVLAIEAAPAYARVAAQRLEKTGRRNGLVLVDNAKLYLGDRVPAGRLARVHAYFTDPWPKRRHRKRRFFTEETPAILHRALEPDGLLLFATDNAAYAGQVCVLLGGSPLFARDDDEERRLLALGSGHAFSPTNYESKYREEGRVIRRYAFRRV